MKEHSTKTLKRETTETVKIYLKKIGGMPKTTKTVPLRNNSFYKISLSFRKICHFCSFSDLNIKKLTAIKKSKNKYTIKVLQIIAA